MRLEGCCSTIELHPQVPESLAAFTLSGPRAGRQDEDRTYVY